MSEATQTQTLEQALNKTDFGHVLFENRKLIFSLIMIIFISVTGYLLWQQSRHHTALDQSVKVFDFQSKVWAEAKAGKLPVPDLIKSFESLDKEVQLSPVMVPVALDMGKYLYEKNLLAEADTVLSKVNLSHPITAFFVNMQRAVILEKTGKIGEAIALLEKLAQNKDGLMTPKVNLELGRLNLANGQKGKAQTHFEYILNTFPNDEQAKLAKLYLAKLAQ